MVAEIPPVWLRSTHSRLFALVCLIWNGFFIWMTWAIAGIPNLPISIAGFLLLTRLIGLWLLGDFLFRAASSIQIRIDQQNFWLQRCLLGLCYRKVQGRTENINQVKLSGISLPLNKKFLTVCLLSSKWRKHRFGSFLTQQEKEWLVGEIKAFLEKMR